MFLNIIKQSRSSYLKRAIVYIALFAVIITSALIHTMTSSYSQDVLSGIDYYVMISPLFLRNSSDEVREYSEKEERFYRLYEDIKAEIAPAYADADGHSSFNMPVCVKKIDGENVYYLIQDRFDTAHQIEDGPMIPGPVYKHQMQDEYIRKFRQILYGGFRYADDPDFSNLRFEDIVLTQGRSFTEEEIEEGEKVCIVPGGTILFDASSWWRIPDGIYAGDHIERIRPGDTIELHLINMESGDTVDSVELEVIGKYLNKGDGMHSIDGSALGGSGVEIIIPYSLARQIEKRVLEEDLVIDDPERFLSGSSQLLNVEPLLFRCATLDELDTLIAYVENSDLYQTGDISYYATTYEYTSFLASILSFSDGIRLISFLAIGITIASTVLMNAVQSYRSRRDLFLSYSLGNRKTAVSLVYAAVEGLLSLVSFILACVLSVGLIKVLSSKIFEAYDGFTIDSSFGMFRKEIVIEPFDLSAHLSLVTVLETALPYILLTVLVFAVSFLSNLIVFDRVYYRSVLNENE